MPTNGLQDRDLRIGKYLGWIKDHSARNIAIPDLNICYCQHNSYVVHNQNILRNKCPWRPVYNNTRNCQIWNFSTRDAQDMSECLQSCSVRYHTLIEVKTFSFRIPLSSITHASQIVPVESSLKIFYCLPHFYQVIVVEWFI